MSIDGERKDAAQRRWRRVDAALEELLDLEPDRRGEALAALEREDPSLAEEVAELLASAEEPRDRLAEAVSDALELSVAETPPPEQVGPYRLVREVGRGGMSVVYLAERDDRHYRQQVAVKLLKKGLETEDFLRRLRQERQILAGLDHPAIPRLLGGGTTDEGQPYLAMEYVEGEPIDIFCDQRRLGIVERLRLFLAVCDAVQVAHGQLIIHRDLKPANILVTPKGEPKLLDFGIAKILDASHWPHTRAETRHGARLLTPGFASPEQMAGQAQSTTTDVYSLGVLLRLLLSGERPEAPDAPTGTRRAEGRNDPAVAAARGTTPGRLRRRLRGDLKIIQATALHPEPGRRYGSVQGLAEDLRRYLENRPISARADSLPYRAGKFLRRYRGLVAAAGLLILSLSAGLVGTTWQAQRAQRQQARAEQFLDLLVDASSAADPWRRAGSEVSIDQVLDDWTRRLRTWMERFPADRAEVLETIGKVYLNQGRFADADEALTTALAERERAQGPDHPDLAVVLGRLSELRFAQGRADQAEPLARRALDLRRAGGEDAAVAEGLNDLAAILEAQGRTDEALPLYRQAVELRRDLFGPDHPATANSLGNLGALEFHRGHLETAEDLLRQAVAGLERAQGAAHPATTEHRSNLAAVLQEAGKLAEAEALVRDALDEQRDVLGEAHPQVASSRIALALILSRSGRQGEAEDTLRAALASQQGRDGHPLLVAEISGHLADLRFVLGDREEAESLYRQAVEIRRDHPAARPADRRRSLGRLANLLRHLERHDEAVPVYRELLADAPAEPGAEGFDRARWLIALGKSLAALDRTEDARARFTEAARLRESQGQDAGEALSLAAALPSSAPRSADR